MANRQIGWSQESNLLWQIGNQIDRFEKVIFTSLSNTVPSSRTLTINGVTYDLSANRTWTVSGGISGTIATGQVAFGSALNTVAGSAGLTYSDSAGQITLSKSQNTETLLNISNSSNTAAAAASLYLTNNSGYGRGFISHLSTTYTSYKTLNSGDLAFYKAGSGDISFLVDETAGKIKFSTGASATPRMTLAQTGNLLIGTTIDSGQRLQVQGTSLLNGGTSVVGNLNVNNIVGYSGSVFIEPGTSFSNITLKTFGTDTSFVRINSTVVFNHTSGNVYSMVFDQAYAPTSGTGTQTYLRIAPSINQTGGANGIIKGISIAPTLTAASDWRSIEWNNNTGWGLYGVGTADNFLGGGLLINGVLRETITTNRQTVSYTLALADRGKLVETNVGAANTITVPPNSSILFPIGTKIDISQYGAGQTTIVPGAGVTVRSALGALKLSAQYSGASLVKIGTDEWYLFGDITV